MNEHHPVLVQYRNRRSEGDPSDLLLCSSICLYLLYARKRNVMSQQELTDYIMERQGSEGVWERKVSECLTSSVDENSLKEYIHRGQEFGRISFDYSDRDTVLGKLYFISSSCGCSSLVRCCSPSYSTTIS